jgi:hypothetical protein
MYPKAMSGGKFKSGMTVDKMVKESVDLDESTKAYAASLEKMANDRKLKNISKKDRDILAKLADMMKNANEEVEEAKAPKAKGLNIYGSEISGLKNKKGRPHTVKPMNDKGKLTFRVTDEFGSFKTVDLKTFAKEFG